MHLRPLRPLCGLKRRRSCTATGWTPDYWAAPLWPIELCGVTGVVFSPWPRTFYERVREVCMGRCALRVNARGIPLSSVSFCACGFLS
jgi:hypothetical protein